MPSDFDSLTAVCLSTPNTRGSSHHPAPFSDSPLFLQERVALGEQNELPTRFLEAVSKTYVSLAEKITGEPLPAISEDPRAEIITCLRDEFGLID